MLPHTSHHSALWGGGAHYSFVQASSLPTHPRGSSGNTSPVGGSESPHPHHHLPSLPLPPSFLSPPSSLLLSFLHQFSVPLTNTPGSMLLLPGTRPQCPQLQETGLVKRSLPALQYDRREQVRKAVTATSKEICSGALPTRELLPVGFRATSPVLSHWHRNFL